MIRDPDRYYAALGVDPAASTATIVAAFRRQAHRVHPDVPHTGDTKASIALKAAYDILVGRKRPASHAFDWVVI